MKRSFKSLAFLLLLAAPGAAFASPSGAVIADRPVKHHSRLFKIVTAPARVAEAISPVRLIRKERRHSEEKAFFALNVPRVTADPAAAEPQIQPPNVQLACPAGYSPLNATTTRNSSTGFLLYNFCYNDLGTLIDQIGGASAPSISAIGPVYNILDPTLSPAFVCDGSHDDTAALNSLFSLIVTNGGGHIYVPRTSCVFSTAEVTIPNNNASVPNQPTIIIEGAGESGNYTAGATQTPNGGSIWNFTYNAPDAKLVSLGAGYLEIFGMTFEDTGSDCATFILDTNTTLHFHNNEIYGTKAGASACNKGIVLGGTGSTVGGLVSSPFQGYHTVITQNFANKVAQFVKGQSFANTVQVTLNTIGPASGNPTGGAIEFGGNSGAGYDIGNIIQGNSCEMYQYEFCVNFPDYAESGSIDRTNCFDSAGTGVAVACVNFATVRTQYNDVTAGFFDEASDKGYQDVDGSNTYHSSAQSDPSVFAQPVHFTNVVTSYDFNSAFHIHDSATNDDIAQQLLPSSGSFTWRLNWEPAGGPDEQPFQIGRSSSTTLGVVFGTASDTTVNVESNSGANLFLRTINASNELFLCGGNAVCGTGLNNLGQLTNNDGLIAKGTQSVSGCSLSSAVGGAWAGSFLSGTTGTCTVTITFPNSAPNGWTCDVHDLTTPADPVNQTGSAGTTCTVSGTTVSGDLLTWKALGF